MLSATLRGLAQGNDASGASSEACPGPQAPTWRADAQGETLAELREIIQRFPAEIPGVVSVVEGESVSTEGLEAGSDWAMVVTFENAGARDGYLDHPTHLPVAALIGEWAERLAVFDLSA